MYIKEIVVAKLQIPLLRTFTTALRSTNSIEDVIVILKCDNGLVGYGSAASTPAITGDTTASIIGAIITVIAPKLLNQDIANFESLLLLIQNSMINNTSAKAAVDMALYDLIAQKCNLPLYKFLGGGTNKVKTLTMISIKDKEDMVEDANLFIQQGFDTLKIKVGLNPSDDIACIKAIRDSVGQAIQIVTDANQGWDAKSSLYVINELFNNKLGVTMVEQPVKSWDLAGLKYIRDNSPIPIFADESLYDIKDTLEIISKQIADGINIKLMKSGGIYQAKTIYELATKFNVPCMAGCMLESPISIAAMASLITSRANIKLVDLDPITMIKDNPVKGGAKLDGCNIILSNDIGLGIKHIDNLVIVDCIK